MASLRRLVHLRSEINDIGDLLQVRRKFQIGRSGINRVVADNHQRVDLATGHVASQLIQRPICGRRLIRSAGTIGDHRSHIAERLIDLMDYCMDAGRLPGAGD